MSINLESPTQRAAIVAVFTAACVASNFLLIGVVNVKFMDLIVFIAGFIFGPLIGASVGILTWMVYGTINPYGFSLPILMATSIGESLYGIAGGLLGARSPRVVSLTLSTSVKFAIIGFLLTFIYDLMTNVTSGLTAGIPITVALLSGIPFAIVHEFSNALFFFIGAPPLASALCHLFKVGSTNE